MKAVLGPMVASLVTSAGLRTLQRRSAALTRTLAGRRPTVHYFHQHGDPYSALAAAAVPELRSRYAIEVVAHAVSPPDAAAAPEREKLAALAERDAALLSRRLRIAPLDDLTAAGIPPSSPDELRKGDSLRRRRGHYLGAMFYFEGEWYWGLDRLAFLEDRLQPFRRPGTNITPVAPRPEAMGGPARSAQVPGLTLEAFVSFRSPYTYLAFDRAARLARAYGATFAIRFVLPMVMRGLPVPAAKRLYIVRDCKREAERLGMPFGRICDPVGRPAERGLAVLYRAISAGRGEAFAESFLRGVFAEGVDAGSERGLDMLAERAGVDGATVRAALADESWRSVAEQNRQTLFAEGLWGVPSFRVIAPGGSRQAHWGQDRLWAVEDDLRAAVAQEAVA